MPDDGKAPIASPLLADLRGLTAATLPELDALFASAREALRAYS